MSRTLTSIGHCSAKLRRRLEIEEEEALSFQIKVRRRRPEDELVKGASGGRWHASPSFGTPGPFSSRPKSPEGFVSFHYAITTVSKNLNGKSVVSSSRGMVSETDRSSGDHDKYVCRDGAVMTIGPTAYDKYAARTSATDLSAGQPKIALVSNISLDPVERAGFWDAVDATARKPGPDRLILDPTRGSKKEWKALAAAIELPANVRQMAAEVVDGKRTRKEEFPMSVSEAKAMIELICRFVPNADRKKGLVRFARGRKGRTQYRLETELPDGLDNAARVRVMFKMAEAVEEIGAMFTLALHEPDEHNDDRNFHLHLVAHDRPASLIDGKWDFTIAEPVPGQSGRMRFSDRKKKIVVDSLKTATSRGDFEAFLKKLRWKFADFCNEELRAAGQTRLFDPRKYSQMGIDRKPTKPLGTRLAPLEAAGVPTKVGIGNAEIIWTYELKTRLRRCEADRSVRQEGLNRLQTFANRLSQSAPGAAMTRALLKRARDAADLLDVVEPELAEYDVTLAMARARPAKVVDTCSRILQKVAAGGGTSTDRRNRSRIEQRRDDAAAFLSEIDRIDRANQTAIADQRPAIDRARSDVAAAYELAASFELSSLAPRSPHVEETTPISSAKSVSVPVPTMEKVISADQRTVDLSFETAPAPTKAAANEHDSLVSLQSVITRIIEDRLLVLGPEHHGGEGYRAAKISRDELRVLRAPDASERAQFELGRVAKQQAEEIDAAYLAYRAHGRVRAEEVAAADNGRPSASHNPLGVLMAYKDHPRAARLMGGELPEVGSKQGGIQSFWRRIRHSVGQALSSPDDVLVERVAESGDEPTPEHVAAQELKDVPALAGPSRDAAIDAYTEVIRIDPDVVLVTVDGILRVDPESVPDWRFSATAWEDHEAVKKAIEDRWTEEQEKERQLKNVEQFREAKRAEIVAELEAGRLIARWEKGEWVVTGADSDLVFIAQKWRDNPNLIAAFEKEAFRQASKPKPSSQRSSPRLQPSVSKPRQPASAAISVTPTSLSTQSPSPVANYTLAQQQWLRDRQSGRPGR